jgi:hypothetical protein
MPLPPLFDDADPTGCRAYLACRDHEMTKREARDALEATWQRVGRLCPEEPEQFVRQFRQDFHARAWELFLIAVLVDAGLALERAPRRGPDICVRLATGKRCWIEAVAPTPGVGDDAVFQRPPGPWRGSLPKDDTLMLRYRSVLEDKLRDLDRYKADGIVAPDDAYLIAVYQGAIIDSDLHDDDLPALAKAVFGVGDTVMHLVPYSDQPPTVETMQRDQVVKRKGAPVSTTFFLEERTRFVSGLLFARHAVWSLPWSAAETLGMIHRPDAANPVPRSEIPSRCEMWVEADGSLAFRGRCASHGFYAGGAPRA